MQTRVITFHGTKMGPYGLPEPFHRYMVVCGPAPELFGSGKSVASVVPITQGAPKLESDHFVGESEKDAIEKAAAALRALSGNKGLKES
jgi:hypothetical protein